IHIGDSQPRDGGAERDSEQRIYELQPGVILFRHSTERKLLLLFLVGETPTAGIHKVAFTASLDFLKKCKSYHDPVQPLLVLGPYFSGSRTSLQVAIQAWSARKAGGQTFEVVCGSATTIMPHEFVYA